MSFKEYDFQNNAVNSLYNYFVLNKVNNEKAKSVVLQAPTGAGKTAILIKLMDKILQKDDYQDLAFVWLTPGAGELEEQSWAKTSRNANYVNACFLNDSLMNGFQPGTVTFLNWEMVSNKKNIALRDGEKTNLNNAVKSALDRGVHFILIIDEEHRNQTMKAQEIVDKFQADIIYKASATPIEEKDAKYVIVPEDEVIGAGLITQSVILNDQFAGAGSIEDLHAGDEDFLDEADKKRRSIKDTYRKISKDINPLVLIQFPDDKKYDNEVETKVKEVSRYLKEELGQKDDEIAIWLSDEHTNIKDITSNNSQVNYLLMKQAVATGWDAPRAKILVKLRLNTKASFTIQTIGRIRRMPEQHFYDKDVLNNSYVYSNDSSYVNEVIKSGMGSGIVQMSLNKGVTSDLFNINSEKLEQHPYKDVATVTKALRNEFVNEFHLSNDVEKNEAQFKKYGWKFGREITTTVKTGQVSNIEDITTKTREVSAPIPIVNTRDWGYRYDAVMETIKPYLHVGNEVIKIRAIINDLFSISDPGSDVKQLLKLSPKDRYGFIINNAELIKSVAINMDAHYEFYEQLKANESLIKTIPFLLPIREGYPDNGEKGELLAKNVYAGYSTSNWVKQSSPERAIEKQLNNYKDVAWFYRSKDHGSKYFSICYDQDTRDFYPDYLVKDKKGTTYILETKGAEGQNIDRYAKLKFLALKDYAENECSDNVVFAFVRPSLQHKGVLLYNNTVWDERVDQSEHWKPLEELFINNNKK